MLRKTVLLIAVIATVGGAAAMFARVPPGWIFVFWGALIVLSLVYERVHYKALETGSPGPGWTRTSERFVDEESGEAVTVWLNPSSGERRYVRG